MASLFWPFSPASTSSSSQTKEYCELDSITDKMFEAINIKDKTKQREIKDKIAKYNVENKDKLIEKLSREELVELFDEEVGNKLRVYFHKEERDITIFNREDENETISCRINEVNQKYINENFFNNSIIDEEYWKSDPYLVIEKRDGTQIVARLKVANENKLLPLLDDYDIVYLPWKFKGNASEVYTDSAFAESRQLINYAADIAFKSTEEPPNDISPNILERYESINFGFHGHQGFITAYSRLKRIFYLIIPNPPEDKGINVSFAGISKTGDFNTDVYLRAKGIPILFIFNQYYDYYYQKVEESEKKKFTFVICGNQVGGSIASMLTVMLLEGIAGNIPKGCDIFNISYNSPNWCDEEYRKYLLAQNYSIMERPIANFLIVNHRADDIYYSYANSFNYGLLLRNFFDDNSFEYTTSVTWELKKKFLDTLTNRKNQSKELEKDFLFEKLYVSTNENEKTLEKLLEPKNDAFKVTSDLDVCGLEEIDDALRPLGKMLSIESKTLLTDLSMGFRRLGKDSYSPILSFTTQYGPIISKVFYRLNSKDEWIEMILSVPEVHSMTSGDEIEMKVFVGKSLKSNQESELTQCSVKICSYFKVYEIDSLKINLMSSKDEFQVNQLQTFEYWLLFCDYDEFERLCAILFELDPILEESKVQNYFADLPETISIASLVKEMRNKKEKENKDFEVFGKNLYKLNNYLVKSIYKRIIPTSSLTILLFAGIGGVSIHALYHLVRSVYVAKFTEQITSEQWNKLLKYFISWISEEKSDKMVGKTTLQLENILISAFGKYLDIKEEMKLDDMGFIITKKMIESAKYESYSSWIHKSNISTIKSYLAPIICISHIRKTIRNQIFLGVFGAKDAGKSTLIKNLLASFGDSAQSSKVVAGIGAHGETKEIMMYQVKSQKNSIVLVDYPGSNGLTTSRVFKEGRIQLDAAIAVLESTCPVNIRNIETIYEACSSNPQSLIVLLNQADRLSTSTIGIDQDGIQKFLSDTKTQINLGLAKISEKKKAPAYSIDESQMHLSVLVDPPSGIKRKGILYKEELCEMLLKLNYS